MGAVIALAASLLGCKQEIDCAKEGVVCAYELTIDTSRVTEPKNTVTWTVFAPQKQALDMSKYSMKVLVNTLFNTTETKSSPGESFLKIQLPNEYHKATFLIFDRNGDDATEDDPRLGVSVLCFDVNGERQGCRDWEESKKNVVTVIDNKDKAKARSQSVRCVKFTYTRTADQDDFTWVVKSSDNFNFPSAPSVMGLTTSAFTSTGAGFSKLISNGLEIKSTTGLAMLLPFPKTTSYKDLADSATLRAGFTFGDYTMGCRISQKRLKSILNEALGKAPIKPNETTLHILFPTSDYANIAGDNGWCYKLLPTGQKAFLKEFDRSTSGTECVDLK